MKDYYDPGFYGSEHYYKHYLGYVTYTDSVKHFVNEYGAYWLLDVIGSYSPFEQSFLIITLDLQENNSALFTVKEDSDSPVIIKQEIGFTDCKVSVKFYFENGVLMFPSDR